MNKTLIASVAVLALAVGCSHKKPVASTPSNTLTDVPPQPVNTTAAPANTSAAMPTTPVEATPIDAHAAGAPVAGQKYVIKQGDTLWNIAQRAYGDGKQFKKITQANPSIKGNAIKVGQTITIP